MSSCDNIFVRFYFREAPPPGESLCSIARAFSQWEPGSDRFKYFEVEWKDNHTRVVDDDGEFTIEELVRAASGKNDPAFSIYTSSTCKCWVLGSEEPEQEDFREDFRIALSTVGADWRKNFGPEPRIEGQAEISVPLYYYNELQENSRNPRREEINRLVETNLESFSHFLLSLAAELGAASMKIYRDECFLIPLNASLAYYRDHQALLDDLRFIEEIWERGVPSYDCGALKNRDADDMKYALHRLRGIEWGDRVWNELNDVLPMKAIPTAEDVRRVLRSERHDNYIMGESFAVLDYPFFMNSLVDRFYLDVMREAANRELAESKRSLDAA